MRRRLRLKAVEGTRRRQVLWFARGVRILSEKRTRPARYHWGPRDFSASRSENLPFEEWSAGERLSSSKVEQIKKCCPNAIIMHVAICPTCWTRFELDFKPGGGPVFCPKCQKMFLAYEASKPEAPVGTGTASG